MYVILPASMCTGKSVIFDIETHWIKMSSWLDLDINSATTPDALSSGTGRGKSDKLSWQQVASNPKYKPWLTNVDCKVDTKSKRVYVPFDHIKSYFDVSWIPQNKALYEIFWGNQKRMQIYQNVFFREWWL